MTRKPGSNVTHRDSYHTFGNQAPSEYLAARGNLQAFPQILV